MASGSISPSKRREKLKDKVEAIKKLPSTSLNDLKNKAEKIKSDPNVNAAESIRKLNGSLEPLKQGKGLFALETALISTLAKLAKKGVDINQLNSPQKLQKAVTESYIILNLTEQTAIENMNRIVGTPGPTSRQIKKSWPDTVAEAMEANKGWSSKIWEYSKKDPVGTVALAVAGSAGLYLAYQSAKALFGYIFDSTEDDKNEKSMLDHVPYVGTAHGIAKATFKKEIIIPAAIMIASAFLGRGKMMEIFKKVGADYLGVKDAVKKGKEFTKKQKKGLKNVAVEIEKIRNKKDNVEDNTLYELTKAGKKGAELVGGKEALSAARYTATFQALVYFYCINTEKFREQKPHIIAAFELMHAVPISKIIDVHDRNKDGKKIKFSDLGINQNTDTNEEALFHACSIVAKVYKESKRFDKKTIEPDTRLDVFFSNLGEAPAIEIAHNIQLNIAENFKELSITSVTDLEGNVDKIFNGEVIDQFFDKNKDKFIKHLAERYNINIESLTPSEQSQFTIIISELYTEGHNLSLNNATITEMVKRRNGNENVKQATLQFISKMKKQILGENGLLNICINRYDIKRPDNSDFDNVLKKYLKPNLIQFKDGLQIALLSDGVQFEKPNKVEGIGQAKDITMIFLIANILKKRNPDGYAKYMGNIINIATSGSVALDINPNFAVIAPYLKKLIGTLTETGKTWAGRMLQPMEALSDLNVDTDKIEKLSKMDIWEFGSESVKSGVKGAYQLPKDLVMTLYKNYDMPLDSDTTGESVIKMAIAAGGTLIYSRHEGKDYGLVYLAGKYYFVKPLTIGFDTIKAGILDTPGTAAKTYLLGTAPFVVIGAGYHSALATARHGGALKYVLTGAAKGVGRGLIAPVTMPISGYRAIRGGVRAAQVGFNSASAFIGGAGNTRNLEITSKLFLKYHNRAPTETSSILRKLKFSTKHPIEQARRLIYHDLYDASRIRWGKHFARAYNNFFGLDVDISNTNKVKGANLKPINIKDISLLSTEDIIEKAERMEALVEKFREMGNLNEINKKEFFKQLDKLSSNIISDKEKRALRAKANKMDNFSKFKKSINISTEESSKTKIFNKFKEHFGNNHNTKKPSGEVTDLTEKFRKTLKSKNVSKAIEIAETDLRATEEAIKVATESGENLDELLKTQKALKKSVKSLNKLKKFKEAVENGDTTVEMAKKLIKAENSVVKNSRTAISVAQKSGRALKLMRIGSILPGISFVFSGLQSVESGYSAATTGIEGRSSIESGRAIMYGVDTAISGTEAVLMMGGSASASSVGAFALPLIPITVVGEGIYESSKEGNMTGIEWMRKFSAKGNNDSLYHQWFSTSGSDTWGDEWRKIIAVSPYMAIWDSAAGNPVGYEGRTKEILREKAKNMHLMYKALISQEENPSILIALASGKPDSDIKNLVDTTYTKYHEFFFSKSNPENVREYDSAQTFVSNAKLFNRLMNLRDKLKNDKQSVYMIGKINLMDKKYDIPGDFSPMTLVWTWKHSIMKKFNSVPKFKKNLDSMDTTYLIRLMLQMQIAIKDYNEKGESEKYATTINSLSNNIGLISDYLQCERSVLFGSVSLQTELYKPKMTISEISEHMQNLMIGSSEYYNKFEKENFENTPAVHSLYKLAQYFGYKGYKTEDKLKKFFTEETANSHAIYWDGENWVLQEEGLESDNELGKGGNITTAMIREAINYMHEEPDNILEHRGHHLFSTENEYNFEHQIGEMASALETGLKEAETRGYK